MASRLLLLDALNIVYRAFYAIAGLSTRDGRPTNAVFGFIKTLRQLDRIWKPTHQLVVFDGGMPAERLELLNIYKAQRPAMPPGLRAQLPSIETYLDCASVAHIRLEGQEADDVLAAVAQQADRAGYEVLVVTSDKDLLQMVNARVGIVPPSKVEEKMGPAEVLKKTGVRPEQIVDWLALVGDASDNISGVPGVGPKTAAKWINQYGSLEAIWAHVSELKPEGVRNALVEHREIVARNVRLMRLRRDLPGLPALETMPRRPADSQRLLAFYEDLEFHSLANDLRAPALF